MDRNKVEVQFAFKEFMNFFFAHNSIRGNCTDEFIIHIYFASIFDIEVKKILGMIYL